MDTRTGEIILPEQLKLIRKEFDGQLPSHIKMMGIDPTPEQLKRGRVGRNDPCGCGSGKKFKKCCLKSE